MNLSSENTNHDHMDLSKTQIITNTQWSKIFSDDLLSNSNNNHHSKKRRIRENNGDRSPTYEWANEKPSFVPINNNVKLEIMWDNKQKLIDIPHGITFKELLQEIKKAIQRPVFDYQIYYHGLNGEALAKDLFLLFSQPQPRIFVNTNLHPRKEHDRKSNGREKELKRKCPPFKSLGDSRDDFQLSPSAIASIYEDPVPKIEQEDKSENIKNMQKFHNRGIKGKSWQIDDKDIVIPTYLPPLGEGFFGEVRVGYWGDIKVACKILYGRALKDKSEVELFNREVSILSELNHPNVIKFFGTCARQEKRMIITEFMENGSLSDYLKKESLNYNQTIRIAKDIAMGMKFLHEKCILHRDLNSSNILLDRSLRAKVADFGLSKKLSTDLTLSTTMGKVQWMAPEVIEDPHNFTRKSDVYSYTIILWELITRKDPCPKGVSIQNMSMMVVLENWRPDTQFLLDDWGKEIEICWAQEPLKRPDFEEIIIFLEEQEKNPMESFTTGVQVIDNNKTQNQPEENIKEMLAMQYENVTI